MTDRFQILPCFKNPRPYRGVEMNARVSVPLKRRAVEKLAKHCRERPLWRSP